MNYIFSHFKSLLAWSYFRAPSTPIRPAQVQDRTEYVEIITAGEVWFDDGSGRKKRYTRGAIFWHCAGEYTVYETVPENPYHCITCRFAVNENRRVFPRCNVLWSDAPKLGIFMRDLLSFKQNQSCDMDALFAYCIGVLARQMALNANCEQVKLPEPLHAACAAIDAEPGKNFSVALLAHKANISASRLFALFKKHLNSSPHQWMTERKLAMAEELLINRPDMPVKQISESCGFETLEIFYRRFKKQYGMPPGEFRIRKANQALQQQS